MTPAELVASADAVILDFDGPMCDVFATYPAPEVAQELTAFAEEIWRQHGESLEGRLPETDDPLEVLRFAAAESVTRSAHVSVCLRELETKAVDGAPATEGLTGFLNQLHGLGQLVAVASNNSVGAIRHWLTLRELDGLIAHVGGRYVRSDRLKPNPHVLQGVCSALRLSAARCVFVGDSLSDFAAANAIAMPFIGFANRPHKSALFRSEGCDLTIATYEELDGSDAPHGG